MRSSSLVLLPVLVLLAGAAPVVQDRAREALIQGYEQVLKFWDKDSDGRLSRAEWGAMSDATLKGVDRATRAQFRSALEQQFAADDEDRDGFLTREELLRAPLEAFDCMDVDGDGTLTPAEEASGASRCAGNAPAPAPNLP